MGEAKRRGTREQRIAQSLERRRQEEAALSERFKIEQAQRKAYLATLPPKERKEVILSAGGGADKAMLVAAMAGFLAASGTVVAYDRRRDDDISRSG